MTVSISGALLTKGTTLSGNSVTTVLDETGRVIVSSVVVCPTSGTPSLSLSVYDGTTRRYLRKAVAMTAGTAFVFETPLVVEKNQKLEVTSSSASGDMDVLVTFVGGGVGRPGQT